MLLAAGHYEQVGGMTIPKTGKVFPTIQSIPIGVRTEVCTESIAQALQLEFGRSANAVKTLAKRTGANERAIKNWIAARSCPSGPHMIALMSQSNAVFDAVLHLAGRGPVLSSGRANLLCEALRDVLNLIEMTLERGDMP